MNHTKQRHANNKAICVQTTTTKTHRETKESHWPASTETATEHLLRSDSSPQRLKHD